MGNRMAKAIQKKISIALNNKKSRGHQTSEKMDWQSVLTNSPFYALIPTPESLDLEATHGEFSQPEKLQQIFSKIIDVLKKDYFDQASNKLKLHKALETITKETEHLTDDEQVTVVIDQFFDTNNHQLSLLYINSQISLAIAFSKLSISVLSRGIKNKIGFKENKTDNENINDLLNEIMALAPNFDQDCKSWFYNQIADFQSQKLHSSVDTLNEEHAAFSEPLLEVAQELDEETINSLMVDEMDNQTGPFSKTVIEYYVNSETMSGLSLENISKKQIRKTYRELHNLIAKNHKIYQASSNIRLHQFCIEVINGYIDKQDLTGMFSPSLVINLCKRQFKAHKGLITLCHEINELRENIKSFLHEISLMPETPEIQFIQSFFNKKLESPLYKKIAKTLERLIEKEQYGTYRLFSINTIQYVKMLFTSPVYESAILTQILLINPALSKPISIHDINIIKANVKKIDKYSYNRLIKRECSYLLHTFSFAEELSKQLDKVRALCKADFSNIVTYLVNPLGNKEYTNLIKLNNEVTIASEPLNELLNENTLTEIYVDLMNYQEQLQQLGRLRIESILNPENNAYNIQIEETYQSINILYAKLYVLIDLIAVASVLSSENLSSELKYIIEETQNHLSEINENFVYLSNIAHEFGYKKINQTDIFILRITRGDFFFAKDHDILSNASIAMLYSLSPLALFDGLIEKFESYNAEQKLQCILFVEDYLQYDTLQMLFSAVNPEKTDFYNKLITLQNLASKHNLSTARISILMKENIDKKTSRFAARINAIQNNKLSKNDLIRRINTISNKLDISSYNFCKLDEYTLEISHIINSDNFSGFTQTEQSHLLSLFNRFSTQCSILPFYKTTFDKLRKNISYVLMKAPSKTSLFSKSTIKETMQLKVNLLEIINNTVENAENVAFYNKMVVRFINSIESEFAKLFTQIDLSELRDLNWSVDEQRKADNLEPNAPHILAYHQHFELAVHFIKLIILYNVDAQRYPKQYLNIEQVRKVYQFIEKALIQALEKKSITTALIIYKALQAKNISRLKLASKPAEEIYNQYFSKNNNAQLKIAELFREEDVLPLLSFIQQKLIFTYKKSYGSQFERLSSLGKSLKYFIKKKENIKKIDYPQEQFFQQMISFLQGLHVVDAQLKIDLPKIQSLLTQASNNIKPDTTYRIQLSDLKSVGDLMKYLTLCRARMIFYQIKSDNPDKDVNNWLVDMIKSDNKLLYFSDYIECLFLLNDINQSFKKSYKRFNSDLVFGLSYYHKKVSQILQSEDEVTRKNLEAFFNQYNKMKRLRDLKDSEVSAFGIFSTSNKERNLLEKFDELYILFTKQQERFDKQRSQTAYTQLLEDVLSGNATKSPLALPTEHSVKKLTAIETLLPENEYDIPSAEPEHPDRIGINRTMSFTPKEQGSVLDLFNTDELKAQFLASFPWARQIDTIEKLNRASFADNSNLLGTPKVFMPTLQLAVMRFVLIAMDSLGKIAGFSGDLTIQNFDRISDIINQLKWLSAELHGFDINETSLLEQVEVVIREMGFRNQEYYEMQQLYNPPFMVEDNPNMNSFCHLNELLAYQLAGADYESTYLAPQTPDSVYIDQISQVLASTEKT